MSKVVITQSKLDDLADTIAAKAKVATPLTIAQMDAAVASIPQPTGTKNISISQNGTTTEDVTNYASAQITVNVPSNEFIVNLSYDSQNDIWIPDCTYAEIEAAYISGKNIATSAYTPDEYSVVSSCWIDDEEDLFGYTVFPYEGILSWDDPTKMLYYYIDSNDDITFDGFENLYPSPAGTLPINSNGTYDIERYAAVNVNVPSSAPNLQAKTNIAPTTTSQTITADSGYDGLSSVQINAMPTGTAGTPTATKGTVSNHSVSVTPSVTNTTGYITGDTKTGTAVTVSASELVSGSQTITQNGTVDVTNLASVTVNVSGGGGGASNFVTGTFTTPNSTSTNATVTVPYTGTGYPIALVVYVEGGMYNSDISGWYNSLVRYAVGQFCITKCKATVAPSYSGTVFADYGSVQVMYKSSASSATSYSSNRSANLGTAYEDYNAGGTAVTCVKWRSNTKIGYRTAGGTSSTYGLLANTTYRYVAMYSE